MIKFLIPIAVIMLSVNQIRLSNRINETRVLIMETNKLGLDFTKRIILKTMKRDYKKCETCKYYHWTDGDCASEYIVYHEDYLGDEPTKIRAYNFEEAAEMYAENYNNDGDLNNLHIDIKVVFESESKMFRVFAEPSIHYKIDEIE